MQGRSQAATDETILEPASLGDLPDFAARLETIHEDVERALVVDDAERIVTTQLATALERVGRSRENLEELPLDELVEVSRRIEATERVVDLAGTVVSTRLNRVEEASKEVRDLAAMFEAFADLAERTAAPRVIRLRIGSSRQELSRLMERLTKRQTEVLVLVDKVAEAKGGVSALKAVTQSRVIESRRQLSVMAEEPIWRLRFSGREVRELASRHLVRDAKRIGAWFDENFVTIVILCVLFFGATILLLRRLRTSTAATDGDQPGRAASLRIVESPIAAGISVMVIGTVALAPEAPAIVYDLAWMFAAPAAALVLVRMVGPGSSLVMWVLAASLALSPIATVVRDLPIAERLVLLLQTAPLAVVLGRDLYRDRSSGWLGGRTWELLRMVLWVLVLCLGIAAAGCLLGWVGLAAILSAGALGTLGGIVMILVCSSVLSVALRAFLAPDPEHRLLMVRNHSTLVTDTCLTVLRAIAVASAVSVSVYAFGVGFSLRVLLTRILEAKATFGTVSISAGAILGFALVLGIAALLSKFLGFLLAEEVLPRFDVSRGTAYAIAGTTRYLVLLGGFVLAAGVAGVDLTTFGFLAGALGVGIGFGLQNIVNNFISGLVLLFERPIQVGDTVDVSGAMGYVTNIGIRASTVHTFDGSEVIVPNADLISKPVINWTRTNANRRFDISVGVAYGSSLESTAQALLAAARRTSGVLRSPEPEAYLSGFGESSLNFALRAWVKVEDSPKVLSDLKRAMSEELDTAGITVAFPQRDVHIHTTVSEG